MRRILVVAMAAVVPLAMHAPAVWAGQTVLHLDFDQGGRLLPGNAVLDVSGSGHAGTVRTSGGDILALASGHSSYGAADFPQPCSSGACPKAVVWVPDAPGLDPERRPFSFGLSVRLEPSETSDGSNLMQKGLWGQAGGQWKLQIDGDHGRPSCVISGTADGRSHRVVVRSDVAVSDGVWHDVSCRRTDAAVEVVVDRAVTGRAAMPPVELESDAAVLIGGKNHLSQRNDQFFGTVDDVFVRLD